MSSVESFLVGGRGPLGQDRVCIALSPQGNRRKHASRELEDAMEKLWDDKLAAQPHLFNGAKFRLASSALTSTGLQMTWGLTSYKEYISTCSRPEIVATLRRDGGENPRQHLSMKVGVAAALVTSDKHVVFLQRSNAVGAYPNMADVPGGHPEPEKVGLHCESDYELSDELNARCVAELFDSITAEVEEETNVPRSALSPPLLLGVTLQGSAETPSYAFLIECALSVADVQERYVDAQDQYESTRLMFVPVAALSTNTLELTPSAAGCLQLLAELYMKQQNQNQISRIKTS
ncbi:hypothetical protein SDRG_03780 [Saprolegnia diclina VS20]|uniref:Nudix hydrolase domain-containing protein n=1 Tax=Saprolegnia diclina (strain VS20) TaxID=1156394 RepID=T0QVW2_SAPDV|nr:hypothetical protein SDRG_03780 [Saprolegnia diclina VS20]EQC38821.1 hypothetical protein SDRG_03780 [Saprolegnia diclina VS20]|eukprot:XP_008607645.1 hypothetical protein SDRG_03780 [Saprolegnia diclina VS20]